MLMTMDISSTSKLIKPKNAASRKYPMEFLCELAGAVLDGATGELMEYRHLMKNPKYKQVWGYAFGTEIGRLAQGLKGRVEGTTSTRPQGQSRRNRHVFLHPQARGTSRSTQGRHLR
jgi:hypothetical protein